MSDAERAVNVARQLFEEAGRRVVVCRETLDSTELSRVRLAVLLREMGPAVQFRAMMEEWSWERIVKEVY